MLKMNCLAMVAWDYRDCFLSIGVKPLVFARIALKAGSRFVRRLEKPHTLWLARPAMKESQA